MGHKNLPRRKFIKGTAAFTIGAASLSGCNERKPVVFSSPSTPKTSNPLCGLAMVTSREGERFRVDLLALSNGEIVKTFEGFFATHAVVPVEHLNRFFVHGLDTHKKTAALLGVQVDPSAETCKEICSIPWAGGKPLHWQPNPAHTLIQYNTIGDRKLHVLNTKTLAMESHPGGGRHSNMAFFNNDRWLVATNRLRDGTTLRVVDRTTSEILSETPTGGWGHGVTVNDKTRRAFVWAKDGVHIVSLKKGSLGKHLGLIKPSENRQRSWFCWTPQGQRYSHDQTWNPGDVYSPWLTVLDMEKDQLLKIRAKDEALGTLGLSPDGKFGLCGSHSSNHACLFDIAANRYLGKVMVGRGDQSFFDRDVSFSRDRSIGFVTNPRDKTLTAFHAKRLEVLRHYDLPGVPEWMKVLSV